jgi:lipid-binding SYLF domain-containing protein
MKSAWRVVVVLGVLSLAACASAPQTRRDRADLIDRADDTVAMMTAREPSIREAIDDAVAYVVFPAVSEGGFIVGASNGVGVVYKGERPVGFATLRGGSIGATAGGHAYSQIVVLRTTDALEDLNDGDFDLGAHAHVTAGTTGASNAGELGDDVSVFVGNESGFMADASVRGQQMSFERMG